MSNKGPAGRLPHRNAETGEYTDVFTLWVNDGGRLSLSTRNRNKDGSQYDVQSIKLSDGRELTLGKGVGYLNIRLAENFELVPTADDEF